MAASKFNRLIRFRTSAGKIHYGEAGDLESALDTLHGQTVRVYEGQNPWDSDFNLTSDREKIAEVLSPISMTPIGYGIGVNYGAHSKESNLSSVSYPLAFTKTPNTLAGPFEDVLFTTELAELDYEGELVVVIGKTCKNLGDNEDPTPYILGYTAGNDVSSRYWQRPERCGGQHGYAKSFDKFAPIGPTLVSATAIPDPTALTIQTRVNGETRQKAITNEMIHTIPDIIRFLSRETTLLPGTFIMTGTPSGVAAFMNPPRWLQDGDEVEVEISNIGTLRNKMVLARYLDPEHWLPFSPGHAMGYTVELTTWPTPPLSEDTKHLLESLFMSLDDCSDFGGMRLAEEVFTPDGTMISNHPAKGSGEIRAARKKAWSVITKRRHQILKVYIADSAGADLMVLGKVTAGLRNGRSLTSDFAGRVIIHRPESGPPRVKLYQPIVDTAPVQQALKGD